MARRVLRRLLWGALMTVTFFGAVEGSLRLAGLPTERGRPSPLPYQSHPIASFRPGPVDGTVFVGARGRLVRTEARGTRVLLVGSSAAYGLGSPEPVAFSGQLEHLLAAAMPGPVEVVNLGMPGFGSRQTADQLPEALRTLRPDLLLVYSGNNEFHELRAWKALGEPGYPEPQGWERTATYTALTALLAPPGPAPNVVDATPISEITGAVTLADRAAVDQHYAHQLARMVDSAQSFGVPVLLITVADNLLRPIAGGSERPGARAALEAFERDRAGLSPTDLAARITALPGRVDDAALYYDVGAHLLDQGNPTSALFYLEQAERLDPQPARSSYTLRAALRGVGAREGAAVCDLAAALPTYSARGVPGPDLFWDQCHFTATGHRAAARILADCITRDELLPGLDAAAMSAALAAAPPDAAADPWRVDTWAGNDTQPTDRAPEAPGPLGLTLDGHGLLAGAHADRAFDRYDRALTLGAPAGPAHLNRALARMYHTETEPPEPRPRATLPDLQADLQAAAAAYPDDPWVQDLWALWR